MLASGQSKVDVEVWMMTSKLFDQPYGTAVFRNHGYPDRCMGQTNQGIHGF